MIVATTHHWRSALQVGAHHLARHFARSGWRVGLVSAPLTPPHLLKLAAPDVSARFAALRSRGEYDGVVDLQPFTPLPLIGPGLKSERLLRAWPRLTTPSLLRDIRRFGLMGPDVMLADSPLHASLVDLVRPGRLVYRIPDYTPGFSGLPAAHEVLERELVRRADLVVCAAPELEAYAAELGAARTVVVENGVDVAHMSGPMPPPPEYASIPGPRAIYVGALREWFDYALVDELCRRLPDVQVVIIGPERKAAFAPATNLHIFGERSRDLVPAYLQHADVGLIPFDRRNHGALVDGVNPLKLYEYCAAGLPVVASRWPMLERIASPALLADGPDEFIASVRAAIDDREALGDQGRVFAAGAAWDERVRTLDEALAALG